jgi:glycosyltransferase involved in cell wall biosynthesis
MDSSSRSEPDLAFVIPARNEAHFVGATIDSVLSQTIPVERLELVVVENGSTDDTAEAARQAIEAARQAIARAPALRATIISQTAASIPGAKNRGAKAATAHVLIFLDADSRAATDLAQRVLEWVARGYQAGSIKIVADSNDWLDRGFFGLIEWGKGLFGIHANMLYCERDLFLTSGGFGEHIRLAEDLEFLTRLERQGVHVGHVKDSSIATSPRRLHDLPLRLGIVTTFVRWALAHIGIGRRWRY